MKKILKTILATIMASALISAPTFAASCTCSNGRTGETMDAAILKDICDCGNGEGMIAILNIVINIFSVGIGILAAVGITIVGVQYLTAGPNEEQTRKSKRRLIEIVIGIAAYVLIYALLAWLLPGFNGS